MDEKLEVLEGEFQPPTRCRSPWSPYDFFWLAIIFSFAASGILAGLNWRRLGKPQRTWPTFLLSVAGVLAILTAVAFLPGSYFLTGPIAYIINVAVALSLTLSQMSVYNEWVSSHGKPSRKESGYWIPITVGFGTTAGIVLFVFLLAFAANPFLSVNRAIDHYNKGVIYVQQDRLDSAIEEFTRAINLDPRFAEAYSNRGNVYLLKGDFGQAISDCNQALQFNPQDSVAYSTRGVSYLLMGFYELALQDLNKAIELRNNVPADYYFRAWVYTEIGDHESAVQDLQYALELDPHPELRQDIEIALQALGQY